MQRIFGSRVTSRSVGRSKASNLLFDARTYETTQAPWSSESRHPSRGGGGTRVLVGSGRNEERLQPLLVLGVDDIGCSESRRGGEHALIRFIGAPMTGTRVLHSGITGPCCSSKQFGELPSSPSWPDHRHQLPAPKGTARRPRGTVRRRTADGMALQLFEVARLRAEQTWTGATASHGRGSTAHGRARVSESCCRDRWFEIAAQRSAETSHPLGGRRSLRGRELDLEVAISDFASQDVRPERFE